MSPLARINRYPSRRRERRDPVRDPRIGWRVRGVAPARTLSLLGAAGLVAVILTTTPHSLTAQARPTTSVNRAAVVSSSHPRPQTTRAMGVPASVQPSGFPTRQVPFPPRPFPGHPFHWPTGGFGAYPFFWPAVPAYPGIGPVELGHGAIWRPVLSRHGSARLVSSTIAAGRCVVVEVHSAGGVRRDRVALPALDADTPEALRTAMVERLEAGRQVPLVAMNGTRLIIPAGPGTTGVAVRPCHTDTGARDPTGAREVIPW